MRLLAPMLKPTTTRSATSADTVQTLLVASDSPLPPLAAGLFAGAVAPPPAPLSAPVRAPPPERPPPRESEPGLAELLRREAKRLLAYTSLSLGEISRRCGFRDQSYFTKVFRKEVNLTPGEFRHLLIPGTHAAG